MAIPNIISTLSSTYGELQNKKAILDEGVLAVVSATALLFFFSSSLYQLALISILRFYGVLRPFRSHLLSQRRTSYYLLATWVVAFVVATIPSLLLIIFFLLLAGLSYSILYIKQQIKLLT